MTATEVRSLMTTPVLTVESSESVSEAAWAMRDREIKSIAVIDADCEPIGILTSTDVVQLAADGRAPDEATVAEYMTPDVVTVSPDADVETAADHLLSGGFNHIPVVDGTVVGILSTTDILRHGSELEEAELAER